MLIQTEYPDHPLLQSLLNEGYDGFARAALAERAAAGWPPFAHVAALRASATALPPAVEFLRAAREARRAPRGVKMLGPAPAAMAKRAGRYHAQLLIEARERAPLHRVLTEWLPRVEELKPARRCAGRWTSIRSSCSSDTALPPRCSQAAAVSARASLSPFGVERLAGDARLDGLAASRRHAELRLLHITARQSRPSRWPESATRDPTRHARPAVRERAA